MDKAWKDVVGYESEYMVSNYGDLKSKDRTYRYPRNGKYFLAKISGINIKLDCHFSGYPQYSFTLNGKHRTELLHRVVYKAFVGDIPQGMTINHLDGNKKNNFIGNLELCTYSQNIQHAYDTGLRKSPVGVKWHRTKLTPEQVMEVVKLHKEGLNTGAINKVTGINATTANDIVKGYSWSHLTGIGELDRENNWQQ